MATEKAIADHSGIRYATVSRLVKKLNQYNVLQEKGTCFNGTFLREEYRY